MEIKMKILVFSDSHGNTSRMISAVADHLPAVDMIVHLGDGVRDIEYVSSRYPEIPLVSIRGNAETYSRDRQIIDLGGLRIMCIHGHSYSVKEDLTRAAMCAVTEECSLLLFGHTHIPTDTLFTSPDERQVRLFNPGSIGKGYPPTYGVVSIAKNGSFLTSHAYL